MLLLLAAIAAAAMGHLGVVVAQSLAARGRMLDLPGLHRMHHAPVARGGGVGIAAAALLIGLAPNFAIAQIDQWQLSAALVAMALSMVAIVGWLDDQRGLPAWPRLLVHLLAGACVAFAYRAGTEMSLVSSVLAGGFITVAVAASINLHNFFDGADGLLATQALFVLGVVACLALRIGHMPLALAAVAVAAAVVGFLPNNLPRANVFLGDVGSGTLGLAIAALGTLAVRDGVLTLPGLALLVSGCLIDTGMTLASRALAGRHFWKRHREHLYQWLIRTGWSHARVFRTWLAWNVLIVLPALAVAQRATTAGWYCAAIVYAFGMVIWILSKRRLVRRARSAR